MLLTGVVRVKMIGNQWTNYSFIVLFPLIDGPLYLACLVFSWVMPKQVVELLACWLRGVGRHRSASVWDVIPWFIMWSIC